jgi:exopolyphosphatase/guanosine-5'-triphosphate,3'-diphosphate pyrophosphatase
VDPQIDVEESVGRAIDTWHGTKRNGKVPVLAALDLGTSNCRLLVARPKGSYFEVLDSFSRIVRLGEGLAETGRLQDVAITRTMDALEVCARKIDRRKVTCMRAVATEACRRADNSAEFINKIEQKFGISFETIDTSTEAELAAIGCISLVTDDEKRGGVDHALIFDIGGGSSQIAFLSLDGDGFEMLGAYSLPWGVVTLSEKFDVDAQYGEIGKGRNDRHLGNDHNFDGHTSWASQIR